jgi:hypothetical protein
MSSTESESPIVQPWVRIECDGAWAFLQPEEAAALCDVLRSSGNDEASRLASVLESTVTTLLASPLHAGTRSVGVTIAERPLLLEAAHVLQTAPDDRFARLRIELTV